MSEEKLVKVMEIEPFDVDVKTAAKLVGLHFGTLSDMATKGDGPPFFYLRGARRYGVAELKAWIESRPRFRSTTERDVFEQMRGAEA